MAGIFQVEVVSVESHVWSGEAIMVVAKTIDGEVGILDSHEPLLAVLVPSTVRITQPDGTVISVGAGEGFLSVERGVVRVGVRTAETATTGS